MRISTLAAAVMTVGALGVGTAQAIPVASFKQVAISSGAFTSDPSLGTTGSPNYVTNDLQITEPGAADWNFAQIRINLTAGTIYNVPAAQGGTDSSPNPAFFSIVPKLEYDTFVCAKGFTAATIAGGVDSAGNATAPPASGLQNNGDTVLAVGWGNTDPNDTGGPFTIGRFTLSRNAVGTVTFGQTSDNAPSGTLTPIPALVIANGVIVPEPASLGLVTLGAGGLLLRRRRTA